ncbi:MAG: DUF4038 domain-containing protein [Candidatus Limnocylindrales bacterium]
MSRPVARHEVAELEGPGRLEPLGAGSARPWLEVTDPTGTARRLAAFRTSSGAPAARYASGLPGRHVARWLDASGGPMGADEVIEVLDRPGDGPLDAHGPIRVAEGGTRFEHEDGTPFLWLADTWWHALTPRITDEELRELAIQRVVQGFTAVQLVVGPLPEVREGEPRGATVGGFSWEPGWTVLRPEYFEAADRRLRIILATGLVPVVVGAWGYHLDDAGVEVMRAHWTELVARYAAYPVVWVVAGEASLPWYDRLFLPETPTHAARLSAGWAEVARTIRAVDPFQRPMTVHPSPGVDAYASIDVFPDMGLTDFQMLQTGHWDRGSLPGTMDAVARTIALTPRQPVINGEVCYEGIMGASWPDIQRFLWWAQVLAGAAGHTYGAQGLWGMNDGSFTGQVGSWGDATWREAAALSGAAHVGAARRWLDERPWPGMVPANGLVSLGAEPGHRMRPHAARLADGRLVAYLPGAALLDNGASDPRLYREVRFGGFPPDASVHLGYHDPRTMALRLEEDRPADAEGNVTVTRGMLAAMPSMEDWIVEAIPG